MRKRGKISCLLLGSVTLSVLGTAYQGVSGEEEESLQVYYAAPSQIAEQTSTPVTLVGVFPVAHAITSVEVAQEAYRVYIGTAPWSAEHLAEFRVGNDGDVVTVDDGAYANEMRITTPAFSGPGWLDVEVVSLHGLNHSAVLYDAIEVTEEDAHAVGGTPEDSTTEQSSGAQMAGLNCGSMDGDSGAEATAASESLVAGSNESVMNFSALASSEVWVDFGFGCEEFGTFDNPFNTLAEGVDRVSAGGNIYVKGGSSNETLVLGNKALRLNAPSGVVRIGVATASPPPPCNDASIVISEIVSDNSSGLLDFQSERHPWIELWNYHAFPVSLQGWSFLHEDSLGGQSTWNFPELIIPAQSFRILFASGKNLTSSTGEVHTSFRLDAAGGELSLYNNAAQLVWAIETDYPALASDFSYAYFPSTYEVGNKSLPSGFYSFSAIPSPDGESIMLPVFDYAQVGFAGLGANDGDDDQTERNRAGHYTFHPEADTGQGLLRELKLVCAQGYAIEKLVAFTHGYPEGIVLATDQGFYDQDRYVGIVGASGLNDLRDVMESPYKLIRFSLYSRIILQSCRTGAYLFGWKLSKITSGTVYAPVGACSPEKTPAGQETGWFLSDPPTTEVYEGRDDAWIPIPFTHWRQNGCWRKFVNGVEIADPWETDSTLQEPINALGTSKARCW